MFAKTRARTDRLLTALVALLAIGLGASVYVAFRPDGPPPGDVASPPTVPAPSAISPAPLTDADIVALWGARDPKKPDEGVAPNVPGIDRHGTPQFIVRGIVYSTTKPSVAFIEAEKKLALYQEGQLADGWRIEKIERGAITVARGDVTRCIPVSTTSYAGRAWTPEPRKDTQTAAQRRTVSISGSKAPGGKTLAKRERRVFGPTGASNRQPRTVFRPPPGADATVAVPQALVEKARTDPRSLLGDVKAAFFKDRDGTAKGVLLSRVPAGSLAARYGFAPGDRIVEVNGQQLTSLAQASQLYARHRNDSSATVTIERGGVRKNVVYYAR